MKKRQHLFFQNLDRFRKYYGWFCIAVLVMSLVTLIIMMGRIVTPFLNSIIWGM